jgi:hypothetical protein
VITVIAILVSLAGGPPSKGAPPDVCTLLSDAEIHAILGEDVKARTPSAQPAGGLRMAQCYFGGTSARSISLALATPASLERPSLTPREFWRRQFHGNDAQGTVSKASKDSKDREEDGERGARRVAGIGDEAYWSGSRIAGALYVLRGGSFIRVSVGGIRTEPERIEKSKALARAALARLRAE